MLRYLLAPMLLVAVACGSADPNAPPPVDPKVACETRSTWSKAFDCLDCQSRAAQPPCDCNPSPVNSVCYEANLNRLGGCEKSVIDCVNGCGADCACIDGCYAGAASCRARSADFDGCIVQTCSSLCR